MTAAERVTRPQPDESAAAPQRAGMVGVWVLALLRLIEAGLLTASAAGLRPMPFGDVTVVVQGVDIAPATAVVAAALSALAGIGLLLGRRWGWVLTMLVTGLGLFFTLVFFVRGDLDQLRLAILVASAFFLNQRAIRLRFGIATT